MDIKYTALLIAIGCLWALGKAFKGRRRVSGLGLLSLVYLMCWGFQYFFTHW